MNDIAIKMIEDFKWYFEAGYITPRDGNVCYKIDTNQFLITASGVEKQKMSLDHILKINQNGKSDSRYKPSIETLGHLIALQTTNKIASVHVHSLETVALFSLAYKMKFLPLLEENLKTQWAELFRYTKVGETVPYLAPGSKELHEGISHSFSDHKKSDIVVLDQHGVIAVGDSLEECKEHIIRLEHVSKMVLKMLNASGGNVNILK